MTKTIPIDMNVLVCGIFFNNILLLLSNRYADMARVITFLKKMLHIQLYTMILKRYLCLVQCAKQIVTLCPRHVLHMTKTFAITYLCLICSTTLKCPTNIYTPEQKSCQQEMFCCVKETVDIV